jgi:hypothetical protein
MKLRQVKPELFANLHKHVADVVVIHHTYNSAAGSAVDRCVFEIRAKRLYRGGAKNLIGTFRAGWDHKYLPSSQLSCFSQEIQAVRTYEVNSEALA